MAISYTAAEIGSQPDRLGPPDPALYDRFAVVAFGPTGFIEDLRKVRQRCPPSGSPVLDLNVAIHGQFTLGGDLNAVAAEVAECVRGLPPFTVRTAAPQVVAGAGTASVILPLEESRHLIELYGRTYQALSGKVGRLSAEDDPARWRPHVVVVQDIPMDGVEKALRAVAGWRVNYFWTIRDVDLVGRRGGVIWQSIRRFRFGRPGA